jgi:hypothetical protein
MQNMRIEADLWHARLYMWGLRLWSTFASSNEYFKLSSHTNICQYVRILTLALVAATGYIAVATYIIAAFIYYPSIYFGWNYWNGLGSLIVLLVLGIFALAAIVLTFAGMDSLKGYCKRWWGENNFSTKIKNVMEGTADRPSIIKVAKNYVDSQAKGFCTSIEIVAPVTATTQKKHEVDAFTIYTADEKVGSEQALISNEHGSMDGRDRTKTSTSVDLITANRIKYLPVWWQLGMIAFVGTLWFVTINNKHNSTNNLQVKWKGECSVGKWVNVGSHLKLGLTCNGKEILMGDPDALIAYINTKNNPMCTFYEGGRIECGNKDQTKNKKWSM